MDKKKILVVDDDMDLLSVLNKGLTAEGYDVVTAYNGINALDLLSSITPDLIVLDRILGDMLGEEVALKLRANPKTKGMFI